MHVPFEGLGCIEQWIEQNQYSASYSRLYEDFKFPVQENFDWLIVMGGPMGVYDEAIYPWLKAEKSFIRESIENGKTVIGICLGSQLIAEVLGSKVFPNKQKEIGWFDIKMTKESRDLPILKSFEDQFPVFHWHGDTFDLPTESTRLFCSDICKNQAFLYRQKVLGLQFHLEVTLESMKEMVENGNAELIESETIQSAKQILNQTNFIKKNNQKMFAVLDYLQKLIPIV